MLYNNFKVYSVNINLNGGFVMKILLVSDNYNHADTKDILHKNLIESLKENYSDFKSYFVKENDLKPCVGCFNCWVKTPGLCVVNDLARDTDKDISNCDLLIIVTEVKFGCYSPAIKRILDRHIPSILPFFRIINGEMHHAPRYTKYPDIIVLGYGEDISIIEEKTLSELATANAINLQKNDAKTYICRTENEVNSTINNILMHISRQVVNSNE